MNSDSHEVLSVVVIGLNEERRLSGAFESIGQSRGIEAIEIFYVDSGSTDRSVEIAACFDGIRVLHLQDPEPSAAKARNLGLEYATGSFVQFLDGDSVLDPDWLRRGIAALREDPNVACVFGQIVEVNHRGSLYSRVCRFDWYVPPGDHRLCGGNALWRREVFDQIGKFDGNLRAGEEPELCYRARQRGYRVVCLDGVMVHHDLEMETFGQYWARAVRSGRAYAEIALRFHRREEKLWLAEALRNFAEPMIWLALGLTGFVGGPGFAAVLLAVWFVGRTATLVRRLRRRDDALDDRVLYALHLQFIRIPEACGQALTLMRRFRSSRRRLSEKERAMCRD